MERQIRLRAEHVTQWSGLQMLYSHATWAPRPMSTDNAHLMHHLVEFFLLIYIF